MSKYTTEVRFICETLAGFDTSQGYGKVSDILDASWDKVFDFDFPIFDENYRSVLCKKILKHYYTREIGLETVGLWKLKLDTKMNEIMPLFNKRYESASFKFNPLWDVDYTRTSNGGESGSNNRELNGVSKNTESIDKNYEKILGENSEDKVVKDITVNDKKTGSDKIEKTGSEIGSKSGDDTIERTGTETGSKSGSDTVEKTGTESKDRNDNSSSVKGGSNTRSKTGTENNSGNSDEISKKTGVDTFETERDGTENNVDRYSDTPQGGLTGLRNDTYLTKAELIDKETHTEGTDRTTYNSGTTTSGTANNTVTYDTQDKEVIDTNESNVSQGKEQSEINRTDETIYNSVDTKVLDTEDKTIYNSSNMTEYDTKDETTYNSNREEKTTGSDTRNIDRNVNDSGNESSNLVNDGSRSENENSQFNTTKEYIEHIAGKMGGGSYAKAIIEYRDSLINVDMEVIEELGELFMRVW